MLTRQFPVRRPYGPTALIRKTFAQLPTHTLLCRTALVLLESIRRNQSDGVRPWGLGKNSISASMRAETLHSPKPHGLTPSARLPRQSGRARIDTHKLRAASLCWTAAPNFGHAPSLSCRHSFRESLLLLGCRFIAASRSIPDVSISVRPWFPPELCVINRA